MSRPQPLPPAPDHERHDPLLVSQLAAGDALEASERRAAEAWIASCGACASLAADLRLLSGAIAREPTPTRRRDYRISAQQAEQLRGSAFSRFMRRLALPQAVMLRPAAAGVLSIGLLMIVASSAWPGDDLAVPAAAPDGGMSSGSAPIVQATPADALRHGAATPPAALEAPLPELLDVADGAEEAEWSTYATEPTAVALSSESDTSAEGGGQRTVDSVTSDRQSEADERSLDAGGPVAVDEDAAVVTDQTEDTAAAVSKAQRAVLEGAAPGTTSNAEAQQATLGAGAPQATLGAEAPQAAAAIELRAAVDGVAPTDDTIGAAVAEDATGQRDSGLGIEDVLLPLGALLAVAGGLLLALAWLARRSVDPLLR